MGTAHVQGKLNPRRIQGLKSAGGNALTWQESTQLLELTRGALRSLSDTASWLDGRISAVYSELREPPADCMETTTKTQETAVKAPERTEDNLSLATHLQVRRIWDPPMIAESFFKIT